MDTITIRLLEKSGLWIWAFAKISCQTLVWEKQIPRLCFAILLDGRTSLGMTEEKEKTGSVILFRVYFECVTAELQIAFWIFQERAQRPALRARARQS